VGYAFAGEDGGESEDNDFEVEPAGFSIEVLFFVCNFYIECQLIAAIDLGPAGEAWLKLINAGIDAQLHKVVLVVECGAGTNKNHLAFDDVDEVGELVEAEFADKGA